MSGIEEKAKTFGEIRNWLKEVADKHPYDYEEFKTRQKTKWVRLEVLQQEIDGLWIQIKDHRKTIERLETEWKTLADFMGRERGEQKQKLEQIISGFNGWWRLYRGDLDSSGRLDFRANLKSLEDLLKE